MNQYETIKDEAQRISWFQDANCKGKSEIMFPESYSDRTAVALAKAICSSCLVRKECLNYAIESKEMLGIYGGKTPRERSRLKSLVKKNDEYYLAE